MLDTSLSRSVVDFDALRRREFARLDDSGIAYLDFAASALYGDSQVASHSRRLENGVFGNPHSAHAPSRASSEVLEAARRHALVWFDADPNLYDICFVANTSAALKLVGESYRFHPGRGLVLSADNHNSANGIREYARAADAPIHVLPLASDMRLDDPAGRLVQSARRIGPGLLVFPAQSNFSGVRHDLSLVKTAQDLGFEVLLDAAALGASHRLSLREHPADFLAFSFYKLFGLPTGMGALIVRRGALAGLHRPWFAGGTVAFVSVEHDRHRLVDGHEGFEDGTPNFLDAGAVSDGFGFLAGVDRAALSARMEELTAHFLNGARALRHSNGTRCVQIYGPDTLRARGGIVAFNLLDTEGRPIAYQRAEQRLHEAGVAIRGGCFCNPGAAEQAFGFAGLGVARCLDRLRDDFSIPALQACLGGTHAVGALRLSVGLPTSFQDVDRALAVLENFNR